LPLTSHKIPMATKVRPMTTYAMRIQRGITVVEGYPRGGRSAKETEAGPRRFAPVSA
jgi:hypothetical protein